MKNTINRFIKYSLIVSSSLLVSATFADPITCHIPYSGYVSYITGGALLNKSLFVENNNKIYYLSTSSKVDPHTTDKWVNWPETKAMGILIGTIYTPENFPAANVSYQFDDSSCPPSSDWLAITIPNNVKQRLPGHLKNK